MHMFSFSFLILLTNVLSKTKKEKLEHCGSPPPGTGIVLTNPSANKQITFGGRWSIYSISGTCVSNQAEDYVPAQSCMAQQFPSGLEIFI